MTPRQQEVYDYIVRHIAEKGYPPTVREIMGGLKYKSSSTVFGFIHELTKKGFITHIPKSSRSIRVVSKASDVPDTPRIIKKRNEVAIEIEWQDRRYVLDMG